jgi:hypothetical protein
VLPPAAIRPFNVVLAIVYTPLVIDDHSVPDVADYVGGIELDFRFTHPFRAHPRLVAISRL